MPYYLVERFDGDALELGAGQSRVVRDRTTGRSILSTEKAPRTGAGLKRVAKKSFDEAARPIVERSRTPKTEGDLRASEGAVLVTAALRRGENWVVEPYSPRSATVKRLAVTAGNVAICVELGGGRQDSVDVGCAVGSLAQVQWFRCRVRVRSAPPADVAMKLILTTPDQRPWIEVGETNLAGRSGAVLFADFREVDPAVLAQASRIVIEITSSADHATIILESAEAGGAIDARERRRPPAATPRVAAPPASAALSGGIPAGVVVPFGGSSAPRGWLLCDGTEVSRSQYSRLFRVVGTAFGAGDGRTTFTLPDLRGAMVAGQKEATGTPPARGVPLNYLIRT